jgi:hypothetical protein
MPQRQTWEGKEGNAGLYKGTRNRLLVAIYREALRREGGGERGCYDRPNISTEATPQLLGLSEITVRRTRPRRVMDAVTSGREGNGHQRLRRKPRLK